jgi:hypothetical protein
LDAHTCDHYFNIVRFDDAIAELASQRGLLVKFAIKTYRAHNPNPDMVVYAPEFMTVDYLKRRIMREKLQLGEYLPPQRFVLRHKVTTRVAGEDEDEEIAAGPSSAAAETMMVDLLTTKPNGEDNFLLSLGYKAPNQYVVYMYSAPSNTDREQQEQMLAANRGYGVGGAALLPAVMVNNPKLSSYNNLLVGKGLGAGPYTTTSPTRMVMVPTATTTAAPDAVPVAIVNPLMQGIPTSLAVPGSAAAAAGDGVGQPKPKKPRREGFRWSSVEVKALIAGVTEHGTSWSTIYNEWAKEKGVINMKRTQVDLKDKWRNLVKSATNPEITRSTGLEAEDISAILELNFKKEEEEGQEGQQQGEEED